MITKYVNENAFNAVEDLLLVPVPVRHTGPMEGFAGQVLKRFALADVRLRDQGGLNAGDILIVGHLGSEARWAAAYSLALCGIHYRESDGWKHSPEFLETAMDNLFANTRLEGRATVATAGIPGTGFSGLRGSADPEAMRAVLDNHDLSVVVYQDERAGDREPRVVADSLLPV